MATPDEKWMHLAIEQAKKSAVIGEVPVGAVLVKDGQLLSAAGNCPISLHDPTAHAEIRALRMASEKIGNYRLVGTTLYVTLEPCIMCMGAIVHSRVSRLVYGASDPKTGAADSVYRIGSDGKLNHRLEIAGGVQEAECGSLLKDFFKSRRCGQKNDRCRN
ncbi:tRNA adenosine(34) deaminase TadA [Desulforhopalus singaporensis]|uniref:tRNA-specific adenosine deaminase n=1 Tax=Desulforhopalus singaporensis TaxID=91360 RepID=A0A1H0NVC6_9BACT|nr:tRNA adenosine(34) deaminase TadA [Desulforhopalus singaporensis]SDO96604.1 tRNA(adenine34) deaminase [Desulforhopalus singaporensis]